MYPQTAVCRARIGKRGGGLYPRCVVCGRARVRAVCYWWKTIYCRHLGKEVSQRGAMIRRECGSRAVT
jgi:hypothetical protein